MKNLINKTKIGVAAQTASVTAKVLLFMLWGLNLAFVILFLIN